MGRALTLMLLPLWQWKQLDAVTMLEWLWMYSQMSSYRFTAAQDACLGLRVKERQTFLFELNALVEDIYGLSAYDHDLVADALRFENRYQSSKVRALAAFESDVCVQAFSTSLATILSDVEDAVITGSPCVLNLAGDHAWQFVRLTVGDQRPLDRDQVRALLRDLPDTLMSRC